MAVTQQLVLLGEASKFWRLQFLHLLKERVLKRDDREDSFQFKNKVLILGHFLIHELRLDAYRKSPGKKSNLSSVTKIWFKSSRAILG